MLVLPSSCHKAQSDTSTKLRLPWIRLFDLPPSWSLNTRGGKYQKRLNPILLVTEVAIIATEVGTWNRIPLLRRASGRTGHLDRSCPQRANDS